MFKKKKSKSLQDITNTTQIPSELWDIKYKKIAKKYDEANKNSIATDEVLDGDMLLTMVKTKRK